MCRSAIEFPPNGKRCGRGDHFSAADRELRRVARNKRQREIYQLKKTGQPITPAVKEAPVVLVEGTTKTAAEQTKQTTLKTISGTPQRLTVGVTDDHLCSRESEREQLAALLASEQTGLAYREVLEEDEGFRDTINSTHEVHRLKMADGTYAYFKDYDQGVKTASLLGSDNTAAGYGHSALGSSLNEVAAYRLSQALGEGFNQLVPETVFTEYDGKLGTLQQEATGLANSSWSTWNWDEEQLRRAAIFDVIAGSQDRHSDNYRVNVDNPNSPKPTLIDNGFAFPRAELPPIGQEGIVNLGRGMVLTDDDRAALTRLLKSPNLGGVTELIQEQSAKQVRKRIQDLLDSGTIDNLASGDFYW